MFEGVANASAGNSNSQIMNNVYGEGYFKIEATKITKSDSGTYAIVEMTPIHLFGETDEKPLRMEQLYCTMQKKAEHNTMFDQFVATYVAAFYGVQVGHKYSDSEADNNAQWAEMCGHTFGKKKLNEAGDDFEITGDNPFQGAVLHIKSVRDYQGQKAEKDRVKDAAGNDRIFTKVLVLGAVDPADVPIEVRQKRTDLMPAYNA